MDIEYLLVLQDFREGAGQFLRELFMKMTFLTDKETSIVILLVHQQGVRKLAVARMERQQAHKRISQGDCVCLQTVDSS